MYTYIYIYIFIGFEVYFHGNTKTHEIKKWGGRGQDAVVVVRDRVLCPERMLLCDGERLSPRLLRMSLAGLNADDFISEIAHRGKLCLQHSRVFLCVEIAIATIRNAINSITRLKNTTVVREIFGVKKFSAVSLTNKN